MLLLLIFQRLQPVSLQQNKIILLKKIIWPQANTTSDNSRWPPFVTIIRTAVPGSLLRKSGILNSNLWTHQLFDSTAIADMKADPYVSSGVLVADSLNMTNTVQVFNWIWVCTCGHVDHTLDRQRSWTLRIIEREKPTHAAAVAVMDPKCATPENTKAGGWWRLLEVTLLWHFLKKE